MKKIDKMLIVIEVGYLRRMQQKSAAHPSGKGSYSFPGDSQAHFLSAFYSLVNTFPKMEIPASELLHTTLWEALFSCFSAGNRNVPRRVRKFPDSSDSGEGLGISARSWNLVRTSGSSKKKKC